MCEHVGGDAAEEDLAQSRMTVGAHDQEIGTKDGRYYVATKLEKRP